MEKHERRPVKEEIADFLVRLDHDKHVKGPRSGHDPRFGSGIRTRTKNPKTRAFWKPHGLRVLTNIQLAGSDSKPGPNPLRVWVDP
jgi:hypothetical protein